MKAARELRVTYLNGDGVATPFPYNHKTPVEIKTQSFTGRVELKVRTPGCSSKNSGGASSPRGEANPYRSTFQSNSELTFELVVQGQFHFDTVNPVFLGLELDGRDSTVPPSAAALAAGDGLGTIQSAEVGFWKKGVMTILLGILKRVNRGLHYSFGDDASRQFPQLIAPIESSSDSFTKFQHISSCPRNAAHSPTPSLTTDSITTSDTATDSTAPVCPCTAPLPLNLHAKNLSGLDGGGSYTRIKKDQVYTITFFSNNIDIYSWKSVNLSLLSDQDLHEYWKDFPLRLVAYEVIDPNVAPTSSSSQPPPCLHRHQNKRYLFCFSASHVES